MLIEHEIVMIGVMAHLRNSIELIACIYRYSSNWFRVVKTKMEKEAGVEFKLRDFRPTFTQMCLDRDPTLLSVVSKQLGHSTTRTTEKHYGRIRGRAAFLRLERAFSTPETSGQTENKKPDAKKPGIEIRNEITGYG